MTPDEIAAMEARIKEEILEEMKKGGVVMEKQIKIMNLTYIIEEINEFGDDKTLGQILYMKQKILIRADLTDERKKVTLLHETLHGIFEQLGFKEECDNEHLIDALSTALIQVMSDNKSIFS